MVKLASTSSLTPPARAEQPKSEAPIPAAAAPDDSLAAWAAQGILIEGHSGPKVIALQKALVGAGFKPGRIDGKFGPRTREAVVKFQKSTSRLEADGKAGGQTLSLLMSAPQPNDFRPSSPNAGATTAPRPTPEPMMADASPAPTVADIAAPLQNVGPMVSATSIATSINPLEALKLVRNGDVDLLVPVKQGELMKVMGFAINAPANTTMRLVIKVKDGIIDFDKSKMSFTPPLKGPIGLTVHGVDMRGDGRAEVDVRHFPNPKIGEKAPAKLSEFLDQLNAKDSLPIKLLGFQVSKLPLPSKAEAGSEAPSKAGMDTAAIAGRFDLASAKVSVTNVAFQNNEVPFGTVGKAKLGADSKVTLEGTLRDLRLTGRVSLESLSFNAGGAMIRGGKGSADIDVQVSADENFKGSVKTRVYNLQLAAEYAVGVRENGDFLELAKGKMENAEVNVTETLGASGKPTAHFRIGNFDGVVTAGRITIPDGNGTATVKLGRTLVKGSVEVDDKHVLVSGDVDLMMQVDDYDATSTTAPLKLTQAKVSGKAHAVFDSEKGVKVDGNVRVTANVASGKVTTDTLKTQVINGSIDANVTKFELGAGPTGKLDMSGPTTVDFGFQNLALGTAAGIALSGGAGRMTGKGDLRITDAGITIDNAKLKVKGAVQDGKVSLGENISLDIKAGSTIEGVMTRAVFTDASEFDMTHLKVDATLDGGTVLLPGQQTMRFRDGAKVKLTLDRLQVPKETGMVRASGSMELVASVGAKQVDVAALTHLPGVVLSPMEGMEQTFKLKLGRFSVERNGTFDISDLTFGLDATVRHFGGRLVN